MIIFIYVRVWDGKNCWGWGIQDVVVHPEHQGKGIGNEIMDALGRKCYGYSICRVICIRRKKSILWKI
jgi:GNAT superfamily N-acetyltransferase